MLYKVVDENSPKSVSNSLSVFTIPSTDISFSSTFYKEVLPSNPISEFPYHFIVNSGPSMIDLSKCYFVTEFKIIRADKTTLTAEDKVTGIQMLGTTFIKNLRVFLQQKEIYSSSGLSAYKSYFDNLLSFSREAKNAHLQLSNYYEYDAMDDDKDDGFKDSMETFKLSRVVQLIGKPPADIFNQELLMLPNCDLELEVSVNSSDFCLLSPNPKTEYQLEIVSCRFYAKLCNLVDSLSLSLHQQLERRPAIYPLRRTEAKTLAITAGR